MHMQEGHRQAIFWGVGNHFLLTGSSSTKQEPTIDMERFIMIFRYLSPWGFGEHAKEIATRAFKVSLLLLLLLLLLNTHCPLALEAKV